MLTNQVNSYQQMILDDLNTAKDKIFSGLVETIQLPRVSENDFVQHFLPCFAGLVNPPNWVVNWIQLVGSPLTEVEIVNPKGEVLFTVPSIIDSSRAVLELKGTSLKTLFEQREMLNNSLGGKGDEYVTNQLDAKSEQIQHHTASSRMSAIFARYGIHPPQIVQQPTTQGGDDLFEY